MCCGVLDRANGLAVDVVTSCLTIAGLMSSTALRVAESGQKSQQVTRLREPPLSQLIFVDVPIIDAQSTGTASLEIEQNTCDDQRSRLNTPGAVNHTVTMRQHQSVFDQMLWDYFTLTQRGENYTGSANHRNLKTYEATQEWYAGKFGAEYGRKVHLHQSITGKWPLAKRDSEQFKKGMKNYLNQKEKRAASKAKRSA